MKRVERVRKRHGQPIRPETGELIGEWTVFRRWSETRRDSLTLAG